MASDGDRGEGVMKNDTRYILEVRGGVGRGL